MYISDSNNEADEDPRALETSTVSTEDAGYISGKYLLIETA